MTETAFTINSWAEQTFGPRGQLDAAVRANIEVAELISAIKNDKSFSFVLMELADVWIVLCQLPAMKGCDMPRTGTPREYEDSVHLIDMALSFNALFADMMQRIANGERSWDGNLYMMQRLLLDMAIVVEGDLFWAVNEKMKINRERKWGVTKNGNRQHI